MSTPAFKKLILFDIDGTILLTGGAGKTAFEEVFSRLFGVDNAWQEIHPDGRTDPSLIEELFQKNLGRLPSSAELNSVTELYAEAMGRALHTAPNFRLMPGVAALLEEIEATVAAEVDSAAERAVEGRDSAMPAGESAGEGVWDGPPAVKFLAAGA